MIMIIAHHFAIHGNFDFPENVVTVNRVWVQFARMGGKIGVDIFFLITGYFSINNSSIRISKILKLWLQVFTYSVLFFICFCLCGRVTFSFEALIGSFLPITFSQWWFASVYFLIYLFSPYINIFLRSLTKAQYLRFLMLAGFCWCLIPTFTSSYFQGNDLIFGIMLYALAAYFRLFPSEEANKFNSTKCLILATATIAINCSITIICDYIGTKIWFFNGQATVLYEMNRIPIVLISLFMFLGFLRSDINYRPVINILASATFGVYLIHENRYMRQFIWEDLFAISSYQGSAMLIPFSILAIVIVYVSCTIIELLRLRLFEKLYFPLLEVAATKIRNKLNKLITLFENHNIT